MKFKGCILLICSLLVCDIVLSNPVSKTSDFLVEVSDRKLNELITKALEGLRKVLRDGDDKLNIGSLEPYEVEDDLMSHYDDRIGQTKIHVSTQGASYLHGLSSYTVEGVTANMKSLTAEIKLKFNLLQGFGKFILGGHFFGGIIPLSGKGSIAARAPKVYTTINVNMSLSDSKIAVDDTSLKINLDDFSVKATNVMDIPSLHANAKVNEILHRLYNTYKSTVDSVLNEVIEDVAENTFNGMTVKELIDFLEYLAKKASSQSDSSLSNAALTNVS